MRDVVDTGRRPSRPSRPIPRDGSDLIKSFVREADQRRASCRFARSGRKFAPQPPERRQLRGSPRPHMRVTEKHPKDDREEIRSGTYPLTQNNQQEADPLAVVEGLFSTTTKHSSRGRQLSLIPAMLPAAAAAAATGLGLNNKPIFTFTRRKLQMESVGVQAAMAATGVSGSRGNESVNRTTSAVFGSPSAVAVITSQQFGHRPKASNLAAKLDAILRSSPWMRRKVVMQTQTIGHSQRGFSNASALRLLASQSPIHHTHEATTTPSSSINAPGGHLIKNHQKSGSNTNEEDAIEAEKRILATFQRFVRLWRERKRRSEQAALKLVNGNGAQQIISLGTGNPSNGVAGRSGSKLRRELDAHSSNVASILSRRMIGEVPALKFFDEGEPPCIDQSVTEPPVVAGMKVRTTTDGTDSEGEASPGAMSPPVFRHQSQSIGALMTASALSRGKSGISPQRRATPRGVCYTLDASGCRHIKMQSDAVRLSRAKTNSSKDRNKKSEEITVERAMSVSLRRKMARRVKVKRQAIGRLTDDFHKSKHQLTAKLEAQLALRQAEGDRMLNKRLSLLLSNDVDLPPHMANKELTLARLRFKRANLQASCQTLAVLGAALHHVETAGEVSGLEISSGELRFLELFRCAVEGNHTLTPLLIDGIRSQFNAADRRKPLVAGLLGLLDHKAHADA